jgi:hypothetical protein
MHWFAAVSVGWGCNTVCLLAFVSITCHVVTHMAKGDGACCWWRQLLGQPPHCRHTVRFAWRIDCCFRTLWHGGYSTCMPASKQTRCSTMLGTPPARVMSRGCCFCRPVNAKCRLDRQCRRSYSHNSSQDFHRWEYHLANQVWGTFVALAAAGTRRHRGTGTRRRPCALLRHCVMKHRDWTSVLINHNLAACGRSYAVYDLCCEGPEWSAL